MVGEEIMKTTTMMIYDYDDERIKKLKMLKDF